MRTSSRLGLAAAIAAASIAGAVMSEADIRPTTKRRPTPAKDRVRAVRVTDATALQMEIDAHNAAIHAKRMAKGKTR